MLFFLLPLNNFLGGGKNCLLETCKTKGDKLIKYSVPKPNGKTKKAVRPATAHTIYKQLTANRFIFSYHVDFNVLSSRQMKNTGTDHRSSKGYSFLNAQWHNSHSSWSLISAPHQDLTKTTKKQGCYLGTGSQTVCASQLCKSLLTSVVFSDRPNRPHIT